MQNASEYAMDSAASSRTSHRTGGPSQTVPTSAGRSIGDTYSCTLSNIDNFNHGNHEEQHDY
jgi:hypothetical protein